MKLIVGLGNPGSRYAATRHNAGFRIVERFAEKNGLSVSSRRFGGRFGRGRVAGVDVGVLEPETYMNLSGDAVEEALSYLPVEDIASDLLIVSDDTDLPFGQLRVRPGGGAGGHKGLAHIIARIGRNDFPRLRFGVGRAPSHMDTADYVLQGFSSDEADHLPERLDEAVRAVETFLVEKLSVVMNRFNRALQAEPESDA
ncbi:MAG: aminoacyl-tRNA hydrolase [Deltaproteobacteria bacterium]|nr:MAG: aminoacyl-tRNA hydrolase [Deltaproteobacteria bacterium]